MKSVHRWNIIMETLYKIFHWPLEEEQGVAKFNLICGPHSWNQVQVERVERHFIIVQVERHRLIHATIVMLASTIQLDCNSNEEDAVTVLVFPGPFSYLKKAQAFIWTRH